MISGSPVSLSIPRRHINIPGMEADGVIDQNAPWLSPSGDDERSLRSCPFFFF